MNPASSQTLAALRSGFSWRARLHGHFLTVLTVSLALLAGSARLLAGSSLAFPLEPAFELAAEAPLEPVPLRWAGGWVLAKVTINGADAGWFMIATGWRSSCIDPQVAARLKLPVVSNCGLMTGFIGDRGSGENKRFRVDVLQCGAATATDVHLAPYNLSEMSQESVKMYGEGISGRLGWDLLKTLPFVLDEPTLQLEWQREATPAAGATRVPMIEKDGRDFIEITAGKGCKSMAILNSAEPSVFIQRPFLRNHADPLWSGPVIAHPATFRAYVPDDDELPLGKGMESLPSGRWLTVECAGLKHLLPASIDPSNEPSFGDMEIGYGWLRRGRM
ncbi:MAG: aspartyl protease family protein [Verrucomicrobiota bacterium]